MEPDSSPAELAVDDADELSAAELFRSLMVDEELAEEAADEVLLALSLDSSA
ncbi:hypothetical protein FD13_GL000230 [Levilactobacillus senmaizukei DSM 21775 = NBRC 103853]|uniref:Uncharacterized protein n=1 Tax=Levilactobacillus senmaizukei DSM 21775 = NBRC 103853 TaxID=1423803 RepID=A0A0R2DGG7_9LACO|nr:hypothetical protein FD13_GL000230 [Levilactobacillus senmaizukei DSM 21775 = NBRC 103853]